MWFIRHLSEVFSLECMMYPKQSDTNNIFRKRKKNTILSDLLFYFHFFFFSLFSSFLFFSSFYFYNYLFNYNCLLFIYFYLLKTFFFLSCVCIITINIACFSSFPTPMFLMFDECVTLHNSKF